MTYLINQLGLGPHLPENLAAFKSTLSEAGIGELSIYLKMKKFYGTNL
jgi:hypothetical protein